MENEPQCLYCEQTSQAVPLVNLLYQGQQVWICSLHFPLLIHSPAKLAGKLAGAEKIEAAEEPEDHHS